MMITRLSIAVEQAMHRSQSQLSAQPPPGEHHEQPDKDGTCPVRGPGEATATTRSRRMSRAVISPLCQDKLRPHCSSSDALEADPLPQPLKRGDARFATWSYIGLRSFPVELR